MAHQVEGRVFAAANWTGKTQYFVEKRVLEPEVNHEWWPLSLLNKSAKWSEWKTEQVLVSDSILDRYFDTQKEAEAYIAAGFQKITNRVTYPVHRLVQ